MKTWLRGPDDAGEPQVELIPTCGWYWRSGQFSQREERRSILAELLGEDQAREFQVAPGTWLFPGPTP